MKMIPFTKFHGFGNDYIVIDAVDLVGLSDVGSFARAICDRHTGVGSDGIAIIERVHGDDADFSCRIINPDGSEGSFSGNGTRCGVAHLHHFGEWSAEGLKLRTLSGTKSYTLLDAVGGTYRFLAEIGKPVFDPARIPFVPGADAGYEVAIEIGGAEHRVVPSNVGNPAAVIFVDSFDFDWRAVGRLLETHERFPERTNAVFARVIDEENVEIRIWERGASETSSSGTCSIAAAVSAAVTGRAGRRLRVHASGGITDTNWRDDDEMLITGKAEFVCRGEFAYATVN
jgi:diaminopimelate epimerase